MSAPKLTLDGDELTIEITNGNKQWVARIDGTDDQYGLDRDFISPFGTGTSTETLVHGDVIEMVYKSHGGKEKGRTYWVFDADGLVEIDQKDVEQHLAEHAEEDDPEHVCEACGEVENSNYELELHEQYDCEGDDDTSNTDETDGDAPDNGDKTEPVILADGGPEPKTTTDPDTVTPKAAHTWGSGAYAATPRDIQRAIHETATEDGGEVPIEGGTLVENEGYEAVLDARVHVSDVESFDAAIRDRLDQLLDDSDYEVAIEVVGTGRELVEACRAAAVDAGVSETDAQALIDVALADDTEAFTTAMDAAGGQPVADVLMPHVHDLRRVPQHAPDLTMCVVTVELEATTPDYR